MAFKVGVNSKELEFAKICVLNYLSYGRNNAIHQKDLRMNTGYDTRFIRYIIQKLRDDGHPICSTTSEGYWLASTSLELKDTLNQLNSQISTLQGTVDALTETYNKLNNNEKGL